MINLTSSDAQKCASALRAGCDVFRPDVDKLVVTTLADYFAKASTTNMSVDVQIVQPR